MINKEYYCELSEKKLCRYGGSKRYNYGSMSGTQAWCRYPMVNRAIFSPFGTLKCPLLRNGVKNDK